MKNLISILVLFVCISASLYGQTFIESRITNGYVDKNPAFVSKLISNYAHNDFEFLVFERWSFVNTSHICILKMGTTSPLDSVFYLTQNGTINKNPSVAYNFQTISKAMVVWQSYTNGRWNIYGSSYLSGSWSQPFPVDTGSGNKNKPCIIYIENSSQPLFGIVYEKENDIIIKRFNASTKQTLYEENLTSSDTSVCRNPSVTKSYYSDNLYFVCYEKQKTDGNFAIYYRKSGYPYNWSNPDTLAYLGNNRNVKTMSSFESAESFTYESNRTGKWGIYQTYWTYSSGWRFVQSLISASPASSYINYVSFNYPVITDGWAYFNAVLNKTSDSSKILISGATGFTNTFKILPIGDSSKSPVLTMGNGVYLPNFLIRVWLVYNKDSAGYSMLYAFGSVYSPNKIIKIGTENPSGFSLEQNYPNPFNPTTKIKFDVPSIVSSPRGLGGDLVQLKIYDITGREVQTLVNESLKPGTFETTFDGTNFSSGVYFYKLITDGYSETKRMVLIK